MDTQKTKSEIEQLEIACGAKLQPFRCFFFSFIFSISVQLRSFVFNHFCFNGKVTQKRKAKEV